MKDIKIAIIQFPGSNCERETILAVQRVGMKPIPFLWNEEITKLKTCDGYIIIGGFSYEDRIRAGIIASLDPLMQYLAQESAIGKPLLGICNGAQILVESGLIPGVTNNQLALSLTTNKRVKNNCILGIGYYNDWIHVTITQPQSQHAFLRNLHPNQPIHIPIAHGEGRFVLAEGLWEKILAENIGILQYCDAAGTIKNTFPINPNGSEHNLAALSNATGNVMAIMPHPERTTVGEAIFSSMRNYIEENNYCTTRILDYAVPEVRLSNYVLPKHSSELIIELIINDNTAISIQKALHDLQFNSARVQRYTHWEIIFTADATVADIANTKQAINESCELFNPNKEMVKDTLAVTTNTNLGFVILVQDRENIVGQHKLGILRETFGLKKIYAIKYGILWYITTAAANKTNLIKLQKLILHKHILFNPFSQHGFWY